MRLAILLAALLASCTYVDATTAPYVGVPSYKRSDPDKVQVLAAEPKQRFERLGEVLVRASMEPAAPREDIEARLRDEAAKWGADAVYIVQDIANPRDGERKLVGIAIRYLK